jgi:Tfp pilus assembly protein PilF
MTPLGIFRKKEKKEKPKQASKEPTHEKTQESLLEKLCKNDKELLDALSRTLLLDVAITKNQADIDARAENAQGYEKNKENIKARVEYHTAGELALYEGKTALAQKYFKRAAEVDPTYAHRNVFEFFAKKENAERAVTVAREYYAQTAKTLHAKAAS